ncbi:SGNH/GDSL hydrolase family protein [Hominenteromicrobium sp.]|uniref:SGNH/GDSL hydrolase family protein n=1 Tax=Hominenteromicrobium sp. TaxID=3073581 RepID=UPI003AB81317
MTNYTTNFNLEKYQTGDAANLNDQYNASMDIIDDNLYKINTNANTAGGKATQALETAQNNTKNLTALGVTDTETATQLKNKINNTAETAQNNTTQITTITKYIQVNEMFNMRGDKIMVTFGDSYASPTDNTSWAIQVANKLGWTLKNYAIGGAGYIEPNTTYQSEFNSARQDRTYAHEKVSLVIIGGSRNSIDGYDGSIKIAATALFQQCINEYPNARIIAIPMLWDNNTVSDYWRYNAGEIEQAAIENGIESIPWAWTWNMGKPENIKNDKIHPNEKGTTIIRNYILRYLTGTYTGRHEHWVWRKPGNPAAGMLSVNASGGTISYAFQMENGVIPAEWTSISGLPQWAWNDKDTTNSVRKWTLQISNNANEATLFKINADGTFGIQPFTTTAGHSTPNGLMAGHFTTAW